MVNGVHHPYGFNGKEEQNELGLDWYDFGWRNYDKWAGRWFGVDPLAELMRWNSPYSYAFNNPVYFFDLGGNIPLPQIVNYSSISSTFGIRMHPIRKKLLGHGGVDLSTPSGSTVRAAARGTVAKIGWDPDGYGRYVVIKHADGYYSLYAHLLKDGVSVKKDQIINNGGIIGASGNTGGSTGPHLHFEIIKAKSLSGIFNKSNKVDPQSIYDLDVHLHGSTYMRPYLTSNQYNQNSGENKTFSLFLTAEEYAILPKPPAPEPRPEESSVGIIKPNPIIPIPIPEPGGSLIPIPNPGGGNTPAPPPINCTDCKKPKT